MRVPLLLLVLLFHSAAAALVVLDDDFEDPSAGLGWTIVSGTGGRVAAAGEPRLAGIPLPGGGSHVFKQSSDGATAGVNIALAGGPVQDMTVEAWVFCEGNDGPVSRGGYQGIVARASGTGGTHMVRLAWDPDHAEPGNDGDGWVKLQAHDGSTWDYLGLDYTEFGAQTPGYIVDGTDWESGWRRFKLVLSGSTISAFVDDMETPVVTASMSVTLRDGGAGFYTYNNGDFAGYLDGFRMTYQAPPPRDYDVLILGGTVYRDGESEPVMADVGVTGDRIAFLGDASGATAQHTIQAAGMLVVPGFIDTHTHADNGGALPQYLRQGVTTVVAGNCGSSPNIATMASHFAGMAGGLGPNYVGLIGHNRLRASVGLSGTTPTPAQMQAMKDLVNTGMNAGAFGLSTGLAYATGFNAATEEVIELAAEVATRGGIYTTHLRSEGADVLASVAEALRIGLESGCHVQISHVKCAGPLVWGAASDYLALVDAALAEGLEVRMDMYPYTASQTTINVLLPAWAEQNWNDAVTNRREELEADVAALLAGRGGADRVYLISGAYARRFLDEVAASLGKDPVTVLIDDIGPGGANAVYHMMDEEDVRSFMVHPELMIGSDGPTSGHPRGTGTFPRYWGQYARDLAMFDHRESVRKTSTLAARQFRLLDQRRGRIAPGYFADIVVLDPDTILDRATYDSPTTSPLGVHHVLVNGTVALSNGSVTSARPGRVLSLLDSEATMHEGWLVQ